MNVGRRMSYPVVTVQPDMPITKAHEIMANAKIHRVPVVRSGKLIGIVTEQDVMKAYPSSATSLAVWEVTSLLEKVTVKDIMVKNVLTVQEDTSIEETARILSDNNIGSLPVLRGEELVGIITETDVFRIMLEMLGATHPGVRFTVLMHYRPGEIARMTQAIFEKGGNIISLSTFEGDSTSNFMMVLKIEGIPQPEVEQLIRPLVIELIDIDTC